MTNAPLVPLPAGGCDCHVHVIGDAATYPMAPERHYTPGPASSADLRAHLARNGLERAVVVQPSIYGTDNRCLLDSLRELGGAGRGIAVVDQGISDEALSTLSAQGVCGLRINLESASVRDPASIGPALTYWAERVEPLGWHLQVYAALDAIAAAAPFIRSMQVPLVLDHFAMVPASISDNDARLNAVLSLLRSGQAYIKLSAPYRLAATPEAGDALAAHLAAIYVKTNPERLLWGSDWPHTNREPGKGAHQVSAYRQLAPGAMRRGVESWLPDTSERGQVLVENPARLYGF
jgi:predicted TIM-barrel fold metal-dependent hydrolase